MSNFTITPEQIASLPVIGLTSSEIFDMIRSDKQSKKLLSAHEYPVTSLRVNLLDGELFTDGSHRYVEVSS